MANIPSQPVWDDEFFDKPRGVRMYEVLGFRVQHVAFRAQQLAASGENGEQAAARASGVDLADSELAYNVFMAAGKLGQAQQVAQAVVAERPDDTVWLKRLAQVYEWNQNPVKALQTWNHYAELTNDARAWEDVKRLAPALNDDRAYLVALRRSGNHDLETVDAIIAAYERLGEPDAAMNYLDGLSGGPNGRAVMERNAALAERAGRDDRAFNIYQRLQARYGAQPGYAIKLANLLYVKGEITEALDVMLPAQVTATPQDSLYWSTFTELATLLQRDDLLDGAFRQMLIGRSMPQEDPCQGLVGDALDLCVDRAEQVEQSDSARLIQYFDRSPVDAGRISEMAWRKSANLAQLDLTLYYYTRAKAYARVQQLLDELTPEQLKEGESSAVFLVRRAEYWRLMGDRQRWLADLRHAVGLADADSEAHAALLWALLDQGDDEDVRAAMAAVASEVERSPQLWGPYAAAAMRFHDGRTALHFLRKMQDKETSDPLWLSLLADAYETIGQNDWAWRLRRQAWVDLHHKWSESSTLVSDDEDEAGPTRFDLQREKVSLGRTFASGRVSRALVREMLRDAESGNAEAAAKFNDPQAQSILGDIEGLPPLHELSTDQQLARKQIAAVSREVALAWALSSESNELARAWLARQYANRLERPGYAEIAIALDNNDLEEVDRILARKHGYVPMSNQVDANMRLDRLPAAQTLAFDAQEAARTNDDLQAMLEDSLLLDAQAIESGVVFSRQKPIESIDYSLGAGLRLGGGYAVNVRSLFRDQRVIDDSQLVNLPSSDHSTELALSYRDTSKRWVLGLGHRKGLQSFATARFVGNWNETGRISYTTELGYNQPATESAQLRVGGMKDTFALGVQWRIGLREFVGARLAYNKFYGQDRSSLGHGMVYDVEAGYRIRTQYPDYTVRLVGTRGIYSHGGNALSQVMQSLVPPGQRPADSSFYMPQSSTQVGALFSFGTDLPDSYSHKWRPFMEVGLLHSTDSGKNLHGRVGVVGSVLGGDQLLFYVQHDTASRSTGSALTEAGLQYRWLF